MTRSLPYGTLDGSDQAVTKKRTNPTRVRQSNLDRSDPEEFRPYGMLKLDAEAGTVDVDLGKDGAAKIHLVRTDEGRVQLQVVGRRGRLVVLPDVANAVTIRQEDF